MSADNWTKCPKCQKEMSFREDYDIGVDIDGFFEVNYRGNCSTFRSDGCGYFYNFTTKKDLK